MGLLAFLVLGALVPLVPTGSSLTWANVAIETVPSNSANCGGVCTTTGLAATVTSSGAIVMVYGNSTQSTTVSQLHGSRSTSDGVSWSHLVIDSTSIRGRYPSIDSTGDTVVVCYKAATGNWLFVKSSNAGLTWSLPATIKASGDTDADTHCAIKAHSASEISVVYENGTVGAPCSGPCVSFTRTTDAGLTWSTPVTVIAGWDPRDGRNDRLRLEAASTSALLALVPVGASFPMKSCRSSDSGASWACVDLEAGAHPDLEHVTNSTYYATYSTGPTVKFAVTTDGGASYGSISTVHTAVSSVDGTALLAASPTEVGVAWHDEDSGSGAGRPRWRQSADGGVTWSAAENIAASDCDAGSTVGSCNEIEGVVSASGRAHVLYNHHRTGADRVRWTDGWAAFTNAGALSMGAAATSPVINNLVGFDVDPLGEIVAARTGTQGSHVTTFHSLSLGEAAGPLETNCNRHTPRIFAQNVESGTFVAYVHCAVGGDPIELHIRTTNLIGPTSEQLHGCGENCGTISLSGWSSAGGDHLGEMGRMDPFPIDFQEHEDSGVAGSGEIFYMAWAWSSSAPAGIPAHRLLGVNSFTNFEGPIFDTVEREFEEVMFGSENAADFCTGMDGATPYMAAVAPGQSSKAYQLTPFFTDSVLDFTIGTPTVYSSQQANAEGVACADGLVAIQGADIYVMHRNGTHVATIPAVTSAGSCVALSDLVLYQYVAYCDDLEWKVANLSAPGFPVVASGIRPTGEIRGAEMDRAAQNLYIGNATRIQRFPLAEEGAVPVTNPGTGSGIVPPAPVASGGLIPNAESTIPGVSSFGNRMFWTVMVMGAAAVQTGAIGGSRYEGDKIKPGFSSKGALIGLPIGFMLAWGLALLKTAEVFAFLLLAALVWGAIVYARRH